MSAAALPARVAAVAATCVTFGAAVGLWAGALGPQSVVQYVLHVLPVTSGWIPDTTNESIRGFFAKVFIGWPYDAQPLVAAPALESILATAGALLTLVATIAVCGQPARQGGLPRLQSEDDCSDASIALYVVTALLISPLTEEHYLVLLAVPVAVALGQACGRGMHAAAACWLAVAWAWTAGQQYAIVQAIAAALALPALNHNPLLHALPFYGLVTLWVVLARQVRTACMDGAGPSTLGQSK